MKSCPQCKLRYSSEAKRCFVDGCALEELSDARIGAILAGRYLFEEAIGEGGMATIYRAKMRLTDRHVAVKVMNPMLASNPTVRERFRREARSAQKLAHPNIIEIYDQGETEDGTAYIVMELLRGEALSERIARGPLDIDRALHIMIQIARGVARAHDLEVIHRDIKPENIFLSRRDDGSDLVKVLDFGIARSRHESRLSNKGDIFGTPQYMAPERIVGSEAELPSDIYSLGVVFFEMLAGELPFIAPDVVTYFIKHVEEAPPLLRTRNARVPERLESLVHRMLAKAPGERPGDAHRVHQELLAILTEREALAPPSAEEEMAMSSMPATLAEEPSDPWSRRLVVLEQLLHQAFGSKARAPTELRTLLDETSLLARRASEKHHESHRAQESLAQVEAKGRDKRAQLGIAVDQIGLDASRAKDELRVAQEALCRAESDVASASERFQEAHETCLHLETRSGVIKPSTDLANAYRAMATAMDGWLSSQEQTSGVKARVDELQREASDVDFQLRELRNALVTSERELEGAREKLRSLIQACDVELDQLERALSQKIARLCAPLRARHDLAPLFKALDTEAS